MRKLLRTPLPSLVPESIAEALAGRFHLHSLHLFRHVRAIQTPSPA